MKTPTKRATRRLAASLAIITALATSSAWAYVATNYWTGATSSQWANQGNWAWDGTKSWPAGTGNTKYAVFHPDYIQNFSVDVSSFSNESDRRYKGHFAVGVGTEDVPLVVSCSNADKGVYSDQDNMWFALGNPLTEGLYPATDAALKFSGGTYGPWKAGSKIGTEDGAYSGHLILDGTTVKTTFKCGTSDSNAFLLYSGKLTSESADVVCNGYMSIAKAASATGVVEKTGGDWSIGSGTANNGRLYVGHAAGAHAEFYHRGGTLKASSYIVIGAFGSGNTGYAYMEVDGGVVTNGSQKIILGDNGSADSQSILLVKNGTVSVFGGMEVGNYGNGTLTINGGTVELPGAINLNVAHENGSKGTINLNGGTLVTRRIWGGSGTRSLVFNGGTLKANSVYLELIHEKVPVTVGAGGGTIDNNNLNVTIAAALGGTGGLTFTGGGTTTLNGDVNYAGTTAVTPGTTLAVAKETAKDNILSHGLVVVGLPKADQTVMTYTPALDDADLEKVSCPLAPTTTFKFSDETKTAIVVDEVGPTLDNYWTGAVDNDLSNSSNWANGVPSGNANIFCTTPATLTKGDGFAPTSITFLEGSAAVTIDGGDFTGITAVTNLSSVSHTINTKVYFTGDIQVKQNADHADNRTNSHIVFAGGAYAGAGYSIENGATVNWSHCMFGKYYFANTSDNRWTATEYSSCRLLVADNSSLYIPYAGSLKELDVGSGAKVDVGDIENTTGRLSHNNKGEMVVTNLTATGSGNRYMTYNQGTSKPGVFKFNSVTNGMSDNWFYFADGYKSGSHVFYIGEGGLNYSGTKAVYSIGEDKSGNTETIRPWYSNFTIANRSDDGKALVLMHNVEFCTDDENNVGRTITIDAVTRGYKSPTITVSGSGTLQVNKAAQNDSDATPSVAVKDSATLKYSSGATFGSGTVTLDYGTTFSFFNTANDLSVKPAIALSGKGEGKATIQIDGTRLKSGTNLELISSGAPEGCAERVTVTGEALGGRKYTLTEDSGQLLLNVQSDGLMIIFR